ncbi:MAG: hypothetical protein HQK93_09500 [Nitrospirae bacterium]|nr:hypothetical protein [Nitrospirota bacterium]
MDTNTLLEIFNALPEKNQLEAIDFMNFLRYQSAKKRILSSDKEPRLTFNSIDDLMSTIDNAD